MLLRELLTELKMAPTSLKKMALKRAIFIAIKSSHLTE
jgi:hypothetical protein